MEGALYALDIGLVVYLCWLLFKMDKSRPGEPRIGLGLFGYKDRKDRP